MKRLAILFLVMVTLIASCTVAKAEEIVPCDVVAELATKIMICRQAGIPISELAQVLKVKEFSEEQKSLFYVLLKIAYSEPIYPTRSRQAKAVADFENRIFLSCLDASGY